MSSSGGWSKFLASSWWTAIRGVPAFAHAFSQVTVGRNNGWERTLEEPSPHQRATHPGIEISRRLSGQVFHHTERPMREKLVSDGQGIGLGSILRLGAKRNKRCADEREINSTVFDEEFEPLS